MREKREVQIKVYIQKGIVWKKVNKFSFIYKLLRVSLEYISKIFDSVSENSRITESGRSRSESKGMVGLLKN